MEKKTPFDQHQQYYENIRQIYQELSGNPALSRMKATYKRLVDFAELDMSRYHLTNDNEDIFIDSVIDTLKSIGILAKTGEYDEMVLSGAYRFLQSISLDGRYR